MRIFVTGATGHVGGEIAAQAVAGGHEVRALVRDAAKAPAGSDPVVGDLNHPSSFGDRLVGCDGLFLLSGYDGLEGLLDYAQQAGVRHIVVLSSGGVGLSTVDNAVVAYHRKTEEAVTASGIAWTALRPFTFMSNSLQWASQLSESDTVTAPFAVVPVAVVDPADIAAVALVSLSESGHEGAAYRLSGPEAMTVGQRLQALGQALGRTLHLNAQSNDEAHAEMSANMPAEYVESFFDIFVRGAYDEGVVYNDVREVLGREPRTFAEWAAEHSGAFT